MILELEEDSDPEQDLGELQEGSDVEDPSWEGLFIEDEDEEDMYCSEEDMYNSE